MEVRRSLTRLWNEDPAGRCSTFRVTWPSSSSASTPGQAVGTSFRSTVIGDEEERLRRLLERGRVLVDRLRSQAPLTKEQIVFLCETHGIAEELVTGPLLA